MGRACLSVVETPAGGRGAGACGGLPAAAFLWRSSSSRLLILFTICNCARYDMPAMAPQNPSCSRAVRAICKCSAPASYGFAASAQMPRVPPDKRGAHDDAGARGGRGRGTQRSAPWCTKRVAGRNRKATRSPFDATFGLAASALRTLGLAAGGGRGALERRVRTQAERSNSQSASVAFKRRFISNL